MHCEDDMEMGLKKYIFIHNRQINPSDVNPNLTELSTVLKQTWP